jgi:hypothetical protein
MLNKIGKEGKTSWDSFSYFLQMGHNVYQHIESVQRANMLADAAALMHQPDPGHWRKVKNGVDEPSSWVPRNTLYMIELVNRVFSSETPMTELNRAEHLLAEFNTKKTLKNTAEVFDSIFEVVNPDQDEDSWEGLDADELLKDIL